MDLEAAERFAGLALACVHKEYPNRIGHTLGSDADVRPPRELTPAFYGCYDWHSAVHGHWLLARVLGRCPRLPSAGRARAALARSLTPANIAAETAYLDDPGRASFERPYGLAWLLRLAAELRAVADPEAPAWSAALAPLEQAAAARIAAWLPKLRHPVRTGEHNQTAFSLGLVFDWAATAGPAGGGMRELLADAAARFYLGDRAAPLSYEPSGEDFLSPALGEADFMRRVLPRAEFTRWLASFLPGIPSAPDAGWLRPAEITDRGDPKLAHLDGLNLSRAWMLEGIAAALERDDGRGAALQAAAVAHAAAALPAVTAERYEGSHWLGTFAVYLLSSAWSDAAEASVRAN